MKTLIVIFAIFCIASLIEAKKEGKPQVEGCEKANEFKGIRPKNCCESYPEFHSKEHKQCGGNCSSVKGPEKRCCFMNCSLNIDKLLNSEGNIDSETLTGYLNEITAKSETWIEPIKKTVEECIKEAPGMVEKLPEKMRDNKCGKVENMVMKHCAMRKLFFNCPAKTASQQCTDYEQFGKDCPFFPHMGHGGHGGHGHGKKGGKPKKNDEPESVKEEEQKEDAGSENE